MVHPLANSRDLRFTKSCISAMANDNRTNRNETEVSVSFVSFLGSGPGGADALLNRGQISVRPSVRTYVPPPKSQIEGL